MGGNALKNVVTRRYQRAEYFQLKQRILNTIRPHIDQFDVPKEFPQKESFGDLDVLIVCPENIKCQQLITDLFHPNEIVHNGGVYSFDVEQFQIDFILVPAEYFQNAIVYFSYSDLGGLVGNVCHKIGLKYGIQGLWMNVHTKESDPTTTSTQLILSRNPEEIFQFLHLDFDRYRQGFDDEKEFFRWIVQSRYFRRIFFDDDQLNHAHRQRTAKRPIYIRFIAFLNEENWPRETPDDPNEVRQRALTEFNKKPEYDRGIELREEKRKFREKFNARFFLDIVESNRDIPVHLKNFQRRIAENDEEFHRWIVDNDVETIQNEIQKYKTDLEKSRN